jgi:rhodanese-related sulfurtransferase
MWFLPDDSITTKLKRTLLDVFNLAPTPPSVNVEEFALMSQMFNFIVDCREDEQRKEGKIPKSVHVPLSTMIDTQRENIGIQFSQLTVLVYDQDGSTVDTAAAYLRDCGAEAWALDGGAEAFKTFVTQTRNGTYTRRVTLEEAQQHVHAQSRVGARLPRPYDPNKVIEQFDPLLDEESSDVEKDHVPKHTIAINPAQYNREKEQQEEQHQQQKNKEQVDNVVKQQTDV